MESRLEAGTTVLKLIERTFNKLKDSKLSDQNLKRFSSQMKTDLTVISKFFQCTQEEALFFSLIFGLKVVSNSVYYNDMIHYLDCNPFFIVSNEGVFKNLQKKRLVIKDDNWGRNSVSLNITKEAYNAVAANKPVHSLHSVYDNLFSLLQKADDLIAERQREVISTYELFEEVQYILNTESKLSIVSNIKKLHLPIREATLLLYLCYQFANGDEYVDLNEALNMIFDAMGDKVNMKKDLINKEACIVKKELIAFENDYFLMGRSIKLTDKAIDELFDKDAGLFENKKIFKPVNARLIPSHTIKPKQLFLNDEEENQIAVLKQLLQEDRLNDVMQKFDQAGIAKGIVVLLYGEPGTGKTETVYNIASATKRNLLMVDIASIKDKYVGESEKHMKQLFDEYRKATSYFDEMPILLFNESDAVISKRIEVNSSVDQMNNSMQNILLQELEDFEGILFATSNMQINLDKAFERRFLYKIQFHKPSVSVREKIWHNKLPDLAKKEVKRLAESFAFTGGQIDNVVRKYLLESIIQDKPSDLQQVERLCKEEAMGNHAARIGF